MLRQAQRLSSVGELASSVAHEFNNILTTIINYAKMGMRGQENNASAQAFERILRGGQRAATIVHGMLGFARNNVTRREATDLSKIVDEVLMLTEKDLSKHRIQVEKRIVSKPVVQAVTGQIEQILLNLVINARQAMPNGGRLKVELRENARRRHPRRGEHFDTGVGIPPEQLRQIFEPFFTTKQPD